MGRLTQVLYKAEIHDLRMVLRTVPDSEDPEGRIVCEIEAENFVVPIKFVLDPPDLAGEACMPDPFLSTSSHVPTERNPDGRAERASLVVPRTRSNGLTKASVNHLRAMHMKGLYGPYKCPDMPGGICVFCSQGGGEDVTTPDAGSRRWERPLQC